jgi:hypothetical protein
MIRNLQFSPNLYCILNLQHEIGTKRWPWKIQIFSLHQSFGLAPSPNSHCEFPITLSVSLSLRLSFSLSVCVRLCPFLFMKGTEMLLEYRTRLAVQANPACRCDFDANSFAYDHTTMSIPVLVRSPKSSMVGPGQYLDGWPPGNTWCCRLSILFAFSTLTRIFSCLLALFVPGPTCKSCCYESAGPWVALGGYRFSAFWLRSSVVSVLISLISDMHPRVLKY